MRRCRLLVAALLSLAPAANAEPPARPQGDTFVVDAAGVLPAESRVRLDRLLSGLLRDLDVELVAATFPSLEGQEIAPFTTALFERWQVGSRTRANRGLLFVLGKAEKQVRFEVAYGLDALFPDSFVSYIEHQQMTPYFERAQIGMGTEATIELIAGRAFQKLRSGELRPDEPGPDEIMGYRAGGAGALSAVPLGEPAPAAPPPSAADRQYFGAQPTAELAWQRFLEINRRRVTDIELDLYDEGSKEILRSRPYSPAAKDHIAALYGSAAYRVLEQDGRAAIVFPGDRDHLLAPWFFRKTEKGWQFDGKTFSDSIQFNHLNQWRFKRTDHPYMFAFSGYSLDKHGFAFEKRPQGYLGASWYWYNLKGRGVLVYEVRPDTPAQRAGIQVGDFIMRVDDLEVSKPAQLSSYIRKKRPGDKVTLELARGGLAQPVRLGLYSGGQRDVVPETPASGEPEILRITIELAARP